MKKCNARGSAAQDPHGIKQITVGPPHGIKQITMFIRENVECLDSSFTTTTTIKNGEPGQEGLLAVCPACGYSSVDLNKCVRCARKIPPDCKTVSEGLNQLTYIHIHDTLNTTTYNIENEPRWRFKNGLCETGIHTVSSTTDPVWYWAHTAKKSKSLKLTETDKLGKIYRQDEGMAMGSPLSPIFANIFMEEFERKALASAQFKPKIWWRRAVKQKLTA
ncbi:hypothetical protein J6590_019665 [Homalodisca vitripennis]|nr:hypothetical protein J6590_019665 [Homalodisca vitripennis]